MTLIIVEFTFKVESIFLYKEWELEWKLKWNSITFLTFQRIKLELHQHLLSQTKL